MTLYDRRCVIIVTLYKAMTFLHCSVIGIRMQKKKVYIAWLPLCTVLAVPHEYCSCPTGLMVNTHVFHLCGLGLISGISTDDL